MPDSTTDCEIKKTISLQSMATHAQGLTVLGETSLTPRIFRGKGGGERGRGKGEEREESGRGE